MQQYRTCFFFFVVKMSFRFYFLTNKEKKKFGLISTNIPKENQNVYVKLRFFFFKLNYVVIEC